MSRFVPWALVALCFALGVASRSISDSFVVFVPALQSAFDASRSAITVVYSFALLVGGTGAPLAGWIVDRFGLRALTVIGMSAAALATAGASQATQVWHLYVGLGVVMGFAGASLSGVLSSTLLGRWFPAHRLGVALAVAWSASGVGAMVMLPLAQHLIVTDGTRFAREGIVLSTPTLKSTYTADKHADLSVKGTVLSARGDGEVWMTTSVLSAAGTSVATKDSPIVPATRGAQVLVSDTVPVSNVNLWFPWNLGDPYLYTVRTQLHYRAAGASTAAIVDTAATR